MKAVRSVLVIGASGKTGRAVTGALIALGVHVRAATRSPSRFTSPYAAGLVTPFHLDLETGLGLEEAVRGVDAVYHLAPNVHPDEVDLARRVVDAASAAGVSRFVFHSVLHPDDASMRHHLRKAEAEKVIRARLSGVTVLRPAAYHQNLVDAALAGRIAVPYSLDTPFTNVDLDDVAEVATLVLTEVGHEGRTYELAGPETLSVREQTRMASEVLGRAVSAVQVSLDDWTAGAGANLDDQQRDDLLAMFRTYDRDGFVGASVTLERLLGRRPTTWRERLRRGSTG